MAEYRILHISDLHFGEGETPFDAAFRDDLCEEIQAIIRQTPPDSIVVSGDIFLRGVLTADAKRNADAFFCTLRNGTDIPVYAVPGNHDIDRDARTLVEGSYNQYLKRSDVIREHSKRISTERAYYPEAKVESNKALSEALRGFTAFCRDSGFASYNDQDKRRNHSGVERVQVPLPGTDKFIILLLLNTARYAGQPQWKDENGRGENADPNNVMDNTPTVFGHGRLCLSDTGMRSLLHQLSPKKDPSRLLTIFVGHHSWDDLTGETRKSIAVTVQKARRAIYLCGHAHQDKLSHFGDAFDAASVFQAGALYPDATGHAQVGFNLLTVAYNPQNTPPQVSVQSEVFVYEQEASGE